MARMLSRLLTVVSVVCAALGTGPVAATTGAVTTSACVGPVVLLVHDFASTAASTDPLAQRLREAGRCPYARTYGVYPSAVRLGGMRSLEDSAAELDGWVRQMAGGRGQVDVVAHGAGSLAVVRALRTAYDAGRPLPVRTLVSLGGLWRGTDIAFLGEVDLLSRALGTYPLLLQLEEVAMDGSCAVCRQVITHSDFLDDLERDGIVIPAVRQVNIVTRYDELVWPYTSGTDPRMTNLIVQERFWTALVGHLGLLGSPRVATLVEAALDR